jgi:hypothetical protein
MAKPTEDADDGLPRLDRPILRGPVAAGSLPLDATRGARYAASPPAAEPVPHGRTQHGQQHAELLSPTVRWLARMPTRVRPVKLITDYPRIVNLLWALRRQPPRFREYMDELLFYETTRTHRVGFEADVLTELFVLRQFYDQQSPEERDR